MPGMSERYNSERHPPGPLASEQQSVAHKVLDFLPALMGLDSCSQLFKLGQPLEGAAGGPRWLCGHLHLDGRRRLFVVLLRMG